MKIKSKLSILIKVIIAVKTDWMKNTFFLDIEVQLNVISQCFTVISKMIKLNMKISQFLFLNDHSSYCYDTYFVQYHFKDDWEQECNCEHVFLCHEQKWVWVNIEFVHSEKEEYLHRLWVDDLMFWN